MSDPVDIVVAKLGERMEALDRQMNEMALNIRGLTRAVEDLTRETNKTGVLESQILQLIKNQDQLWQAVRENAQQTTNLQTLMTNTNDRSAHRTQDRMWTLIQGVILAIAGIVIAKGLR